MDWFLADLLAHQVKPKILKNIAIKILILNYQFNLDIFTVKEVTQYFTAATMPEDKVIV